MAVYKPTYCSPFGSTIDLRVIPHGESTEGEKSVTYLKCKIDSSNKNITGYRIRILDNNNNQIFPQYDINKEEISPISELQTIINPEQQEAGENSGLNGTFLSIPFFQNFGRQNMILRSANALYYKPEYSLDYVISDAETATGADNTSNWQFEGEYLRLIDKTQNVILDGEPLQSGDVVLITTDVPSEKEKNGIWQGATVKDVDGTIYTRLSRISSLTPDAPEFSYILVLKGKTYHNTIWYFNGVAYSQNDQLNPTTRIPLWCDIHGRPYDAFSQGESYYKWELTLYQGDGEIVEQSDGYSIITYDNIDNNWLDIPITSGNILGSTTERVQIAGSIEDGEPLPDNKDGSIVLLKETYMSVFTDGGTNIPRIPVKHYDATLGHVYPLQSNPNIDLIKDSAFCQFFKHSNNPLDIKEGDIIKWSFNFNIDLELASTESDWKVFTNENSEGWDKVPVNYRKIAIKETNSSPGLIGELSKYGVQEGDYILLLNQEKPRQNGIYQYYTYSDGSSSSHSCLKRPQSYSQWSSYIGKVFYLKTILNKKSDTEEVYSTGSLNYECLAAAGDYHLWNPTEIDSGISSLLFGSERPISLFSSLVDKKHIMQLFDNQVYYPGPALDHEGENQNGDIEYIVQNTISADNQEVHKGDIVLFKDGVYARVKNVSYGNTQYVIYPGMGQLKDGDRFYVNAGSQHGKKTFKWRADGSYVEDLGAVTARILKNTKTRTYLTPFVNLHKNMRVKLLDNKTVVMNGVITPWVPITKINDKLYYVDHPEIDTPLPSYKLSGDNKNFRYEVRSFFRTSDENPFTVYESPYVLLYKDGQPYSDLSNSKSLYTFFAKDPNSIDHATAELLSHLIPGIKIEDFCVQQYSLQTSITGRYVTLGAKYVQYQGASWEAYRWLLLDSKYGDDRKIVPNSIIQDTGFCYNKEIKTTFYGLSDDTTNDKPNVYFVVLYLLDSQGHRSAYILRFNVQRGEPNTSLSSGDDFTATLDCSTHSVHLKYSGEALSGEDVLYSYYRREYGIYQRPFDASKSVYGYFEQGGKRFFKTKQYNEEDLITPEENRYYTDHSENKYEPVGLLYQYYKGEYRLVPKIKIFKGPWEPVLVRTTDTDFYDFNIKNKRSYQYIMYVVKRTKGGLDENVVATCQTFANFRSSVWVGFDGHVGQGKFVQGDVDHTSALTGAPVNTSWNCWSIVELLPAENALNAPIISNTYRADINNVWRFKYQFEGGNRTQIIQRNEYNVLGQYPRYGYGAKNYEQGSVSALIGSELILNNRKGPYCERVPLSKKTPMSTNESVYMLEQWNKFVYSKNPKLLKDNKGQSWIVQLTSNNHTTNEQWNGRPDLVSFDWVQIEDTEHVVIYNEDKEDLSVATGEVVPGALIWEPYY